MTYSNRRVFLNNLGATTLAGLPRRFSTPPEKHGCPNKYSVAAYYFGNYHVDPRNEKQHGPGWTEWRLVQQALPRFTGQQQPKFPLWGYQDESDPAVFSGKIRAASQAASLLSSSIGTGTTMDRFCSRLSKKATSVRQIAMI